jgi:hypothetical protein
MKKGDFIYYFRNSDGIHIPGRIVSIGRKRACIDADFPEVAGSRKAYVSPKNLQLQNESC